MRLTEKGRFTLVAVASAIAGAAITVLVDRMAMQQDLEFLGIIHHDVQEGINKLKKEVEDNGDADEES